MKSVCFYIFFFFSLAELLSQDALSFKDERDHEVYAYVQVNDLYWMTENLKFKTETAFPIEENGDCSYFYGVEEAFEVCPTGWRLPTEAEVKKLLKLEKRNKLTIADSLNIIKCGRVDNHHHAKYGEQNTFWMDAELKAGHIAHWHLFHDGHKIHTHNVVVAERMFPVRCVKAID